MENEVLPPIRTVSVYEKLFFNIIGLGILYIVFSSWTELQVWNPCIPASASTIGASTIVLVILHLTLHSFGNVIEGIKFQIGPINIDGKSIIRVLERIHLWGKSEILSWGIAIILLLVCVYLGFLPQSPFLVNNPPPSIIDFTVQFQDGRLTVIQSGGTIDVLSSEIIVVTANVPEDARLFCDWMVITGSLGDATGCATRYSPPQGNSKDALTVLAQTSCSAGTAFRGLSVNISP